MSTARRPTAADPRITGRGAPARRTAPTALRRYVRRFPLGALAAAIVLFLVIVALFPGLFAWQEPAAQAPRNALQAPSAAHPFGTDNFGRDVYSRVVHGARASLLIGFGAVALALTVATLAGSVSAYLGGWPDTILQRLIDALMALPWLVTLMSMMALLGPGPLTALLVIGLLTAPGASRVVRGAVLTLKHADYVAAAHALGCPPARILARHILPGIVAPLIVLASTGVGAAILAEASLSFLGFGVVPPTPAWGYMLGVEGRRFLTTAPWLAIFPGAAIALTVLAVNLLGDALRDLLDPRT